LPPRASRRCSASPDRCDLNDLADAGDFQGITLAINGGLNGHPDPVAHFGRAQETLV